MSVRHPPCPAAKSDCQSEKLCMCVVLNSEDSPVVFAEPFDQEFIESLAERIAEKVAAKISDKL